MKKLLPLFASLLLGCSLFAQDSKITNSEELNVYLDQIRQELVLNAGEKILDSILTYREESNEQYRSKRTLYEYDQEGRNTRFTFLDYDYDQPWTHDFGLDATHEYFGNEEYVTAYLFSGGAWETLDRRSYYNDSGDNPQSILLERWDQVTMGFINDLKDTFFYSNNTMLADSTLNFTWDLTNNEWENNYSSRYFYDQNDQLIRKLNYSWENQTWDISSIQEYGYDQLGHNILYELLEKNDNIGSFELRNRRQSFYNGDETLDSTYVDFLLNTPNVFKEKTIFTNENGIAIADTIYDWSVSGDFYFISQLNTYQYDADQDLLKLENFRYNDLSGIFEFSRLEEYYYSELGVATEELVERGQNCTFANPYFSGAPLSCNWTENRPTAFKVYNLQGKLQYQKVLNPQEMAQTFSINKNLPAGMYVVVWEGENRILEQQKLVIP